MPISTRLSLPFTHWTKTTRALGVIAVALAGLVALLIYLGTKEKVVPSLTFRFAFVGFNKLISAAQKRNAAFIEILLADLAFGASDWLTLVMNSGENNRVRASIAYRDARRITSDSSA